MEERIKKLLEHYYENDYYDYREDLMDDIAELDEGAQQVALEARVSKMSPLIESIGRQLDTTYPDISVEEIVVALKYLLDGELGGSVIIYAEEVVGEVKYTQVMEQLGDKINSWIERFMELKKINFEIVEIVYVFDQLIRGFRGSDEDDQFILIPESEIEVDEE